MKKTLNVCGLLFLLSFLFVSCKKKVDFVDHDVLTGGWAEMPQQTYNRTMSFETDGKFSYKVLGVDGYAQTTLNGKYAIKGDSLIVNILERLSKDDSGKIVRVKTNDYLFEKATFSITGFELTINHITYPADAPVFTQSKFVRILAID